MLDIYSGKVGEILIRAHCSADCLAVMKWYLEWSQLIKLFNGRFQSSTCLPWEERWEEECKHDGGDGVGQHEAEN